MAQGQGIAGAFEGIPAEQRAIAEKTFEVAATPLQEAFKEQAAVGEELLAQRGVQFGGLGSESRRKLAESQQRALTGLAGQIGASALERAFQSSEAAKARQFQQQQQLLGIGLKGGLTGDALTDVFGKFGLDPSQVRIEGQTIGEFQEAQKALTERELAGALRDRESVLREELAFSLIQAGVSPRDIPNRMAELLEGMGLSLGASDSGMGFKSEQDVMTRARDMKAEHDARQDLNERTGFSGTKFPLDFWIGKAREEAGGR
jgi:hypothetical protein